MTAEADRRWRTFLNLQNGTDGLAYHLDPDHLLSDPIPLNLNRVLLGKICSLFSGHCNLQSHKYKLGLTFTPTCVCLEEDETVYHHLFYCAIYNNLRHVTGINQQHPSTNQIIRFCKGADRL